MKSDLVLFFKEETQIAIVVFFVHLKRRFEPKSGYLDLVVEGRGGGDLADGHVAGRGPAPAAVLGHQAQQRRSGLLFAHRRQLTRRQQELTTSQPATKKRKRKKKSTPR